MNPTRLVQRSSPGKGMNGPSPASVGGALPGRTEVTTLLRAHGSLSLAQCRPLDWSLSGGTVLPQGRWIFVEPVKFTCSWDSLKARNQRTFPKTQLLVSCNDSQ